MAHPLTPSTGKIDMGWGKTTQEGVVKTPMEKEGTHFSNLITRALLDIAVASSPASQAGLTTSPEVTATLMQEVAQLMQVCQQQDVEGLACRALARDVGVRCGFSRRET